ncbi:acetolactate synthase large subunit [Exilibacterium tricleocarpae]|uniref:Acetolactate synthase large subunit n=1 Tax=Exilibacterium tricleocarpae TaxID=2591008 RepID=A0A545U9T3_9GAMM|nr:acetolactate synthase large subunit [Exilibacterium tricleocarpae]TQV86189.1 acetolactate synthase large subunit [Exilibacterium tricleocarpae]
MNGAESLLQSLIDAGVEVCFANPGTSEMQLVAAIDKIPGMRPILGLFEGVVTGAADGYGRMADKPAATLLHLGPGFANGMANLHNAGRAFTPIVNIIGDHATYHLPLDAPLTSDVPGYAALTSDWVKICASAESMAADGVAAVAAAMAGRQANLIVPADHAWTEGGEVAAPLAVAPRPGIPQERIAAAADLLRSGEPGCLFLGGMALRERGLKAASRIAAATGTRLISEVFPARLQRGVGRPKIERLPYFGEMAADMLGTFTHMVMVGAKAPVSFFAYPDKPGTLWPPNCNLLQLADPHQDQIAALEALAEHLQAPAPPAIDEPALPDIPTGPLTAETVGAVIANLLPAQAIVSDEANTAGAFSFGYFDGAAPHDWLTLTGGAIGQGLPAALGAAIACPDRKVINLQADGSAMYTNQALWTMARENLDVCVVLYNNSSYAILNLELLRVGVEQPGARAKSMLELDNPRIEWTQIAAGMGVSASRATTTEEFQAQFEAAMAARGPRLIEVVL